MRRHSFLITVKNLYRIKNPSVNLLSSDKFTGLTSLAITLLHWWKLVRCYFWVWAYLVFIYMFLVVLFIYFNIVLSNIWVVMINLEAKGALQVSRFPDRV